MTHRSLDTQTAVTTALEALLDLPTAVVAAAQRAGAFDAEGIVLTPQLHDELADELEAATGQRTFSLEHMRDRRPLAEMLEVARLVTAQRRVLAAA